MKMNLISILVVGLLFESIASARDHSPTPAGEGKDGAKLVTRSGAPSPSVQQSDSDQSETYIRISLVSASAVVQDSWWSNKTGAATCTVSFGNEKYSVATCFDFKRGNYGTPSFNTPIVSCRKVRQASNQFRFGATLASFKQNTQLAVALTTIGKASVSIAAQLAKSYIPGTDLAKPLSDASDQLLGGFNESIKTGTSGEEIFWPAEGGLTLALAALTNRENYVLLYKGSKDVYENEDNPIDVNSEGSEIQCRIDLPSSASNSPRKSGSKGNKLVQTVEDGIWFLFRVEKLAEFDGDRPWTGDLRNIRDEIKSVPDSVRLNDPATRSSAIKAARKRLWRSSRPSSLTDEATKNRPKTLGDRAEELRTQISADPLLTSAEIERTMKGLTDLIDDTDRKLADLEKATPK